ncbi:MAG: hypothetical protein HY735_11645 [Verrucomicrobia bacterium]|nr:hypothetical protein [Verrucomicrobiota bacterium]
MKKFMGDRGFLGPLHETSAKTGKGCDLLREAIVQAIDWKSIPETTSPALYRRMKQEILSLRDSGLILIRLAELKQRMEMTLRVTNFELAELEDGGGPVGRVGHDPASGLWRLHPAAAGGAQSLRRRRRGAEGAEASPRFVLDPKALTRPSGTLSQTHSHCPHPSCGHLLPSDGRRASRGRGAGCIREDELLAWGLDYQDFKRLPREDEGVLRWNSAARQGERQ